MLKKKKTTRTISKRVGKRSVKEKEEFKRYLERVEDPKNNQEVNYDLPENPTPLQVAKFDICQRILAYQQENNLTDEELSDRINLSIPEMEEVLFCQIEKFTLDRLMTYANSLFNPSQIKITITQPTLRKRNSMYAR
jgi:predicted XRE-type DNA-binding protein